MLDKSLIPVGTTPGVDALFDTFLQCFTPIVTGVNLLLSLIVLVVFINIGKLHSPSNFIYFNLVIIDLINAIIGVLISVEVWNKYDDSSMQDWGNITTIQVVSGYLYVFTFDANIFLVFAQALIRLLCLKMCALSIIEKLKIISWVTVGFAYFVGLGCCADLYFSDIYSETRQPFPGIFVEFVDLFESIVILVTISMSVYTLVSISFHMPAINRSVYFSASMTSFLLTLTLSMSYLHYLIVNGARIYYKKGHGVDDFEKMCRKSEDWVWMDILLCETMDVGVIFLCLNSVFNSTILLCQVNVIVGN